MHTTRRTHLTLAAIALAAAAAAPGAWTQA